MGSREATEEWEACNGLYEKLELMSVTCENLRLEWGEPRTTAGSC